MYRSTLPYLALIVVCLASLAHAADPDGVWRTEKQCGVNAAYMLLKLRGCEADYRVLEEGLREEAGSSDADSGATLEGLRRVVRRQGLSADVVHARIVDLPRIEFPVIAHLEPDNVEEFDFRRRGHYVVILKMYENEGTEVVQFIDGASGSVERMRMCVFFRQWSGYLLAPRAGRPAWQHFCLTLLCLGVALGSWWCCLGPRKGRNLSSSQGN